PFCLVAALGRRVGVPSSPSEDSAVYWVPDCLPPPPARDGPYHGRDRTPCPVAVPARAGRTLDGLAAGLPRHPLDQVVAAVDVCPAAGADGPRRGGCTLQPFLGGLPRPRDHALGDRLGDGQRVPIAPVVPGDIPGH